MSAALEIRNVHKSFGPREVLKGVDLTIGSGGVVAVLGPSGSGKSTLLRAINHLERPDLGYVALHGELIGVEVRGERLHELPPRAVRRQRTRIGFVAQSFNLFANLTARDNVAEPLVAHRRLDRAAARERAVELLAKVGLGDRGDAYPRHLSGGQQQRVAIARALALEPDLVLFDEPTSALDPELVGEVLSVIRQLADSGATMVIVTHEIGFAREVADDVVFIDGGVIVEQGPPSQVLDNPRQTRTREFLARVL
ncbi:amino acid ABC transporter ATP-binding protein [Dactylosporangium matsuzakiense]|uniref:Glutamate ABC transporter ATP-binding protein n=1 Tax=Dactylosporangium matsuzakiense TaxID=53360 RepID=A0A9W6KFJ0_9ACTN|nr:amino acid ABC transporter ATP-binding protein [Dactylosporangium matsuzakiense]GLK99315.1 glutamate ABC transporter ATP-binding protein [Dactylosporangium matsuzakiense]